MGRFPTSTHPLAAPGDHPILPTTVIPAKITTIHPQLRDLLVCGGDRGRLYYVQGKGITELSVDYSEERAYEEALLSGKGVVGEFSPKVCALLPVLIWHHQYIHTWPNANSF